MTDKLVALVVLLLAGLAHADPPPYRTVHIDTLDPAKQPVFEAARKGWLVALEARKLSDGRGRFLQMDGNTFLTLRPFASYTELDAIRAERAKAVADMGKDATARYDRGDAALTTPHCSEIWSVVGDLAYAGPSALTEVTAGAARMVVEDIRGDGYEEAWATIKKALSDAHYPLSRVTFFSSYGTGKYVTFWLARSVAELQATPTPRQAVEKALGAAPAAALWKKLDASLLSTASHEIIRRPDLDSP